MNDGQVLVSDAPGEIVKKRGAKSLEEAFIAYLKDADPTHEDFIPETTAKTPVSVAHQSQSAHPHVQSPRFSFARALSYTLREAQELRRDPVRMVMALFGSLILMLIMSYGINMDVNDMTFAVLDRDQTMLSQNYIMNLSGSRYFKERRAITDYADLDRRMRSGELSLSLEIPPGFSRDVQRGAPVQIGAWIDGAMPERAATLQGYVQGMHQGWLIDIAKTQFGEEAGSGAATIETRFRYNPEVESLPAMVPAVIPLLLLMIPAMLFALSVVREKELGSIINLYVTPVTRSEFLIGKQLPYIVLALFNFLIMCLLAVTIFDVPIKGSFMTLLLATLIFVVFSTGFGLFASTFTRSQIAAMFFTMIGSMLPAIQFSGILNPVSSLEGIGKIMGEIYPAAHYVTISRGVFNKALGFVDLQAAFAPMVLAGMAIFGISIVLLRKQER